MTQAGKDESDDKGFPFFVVRMVAPSSTALEKLTSDIRELAQANIERARRIFRSRTLPLLGSDARLFNSVFLEPLSSALDYAILEAIHDEAALAILAVPPSGDELRHNLRIEMVHAGKGDDSRIQFQYAGALLGRYWCRHGKA